MPTLAVVGSQQFDFPYWESLARAVIEISIELLDPSMIISGRDENYTPGGIDVLAAQVAKENGVPFVAHEPEKEVWEPNGYEERNLKIAEHCTHMLVIQNAEVRSYGPGWTADKAEELEKIVLRISVDANGVVIIA